MNALQFYGLVMLTVVAGLCWVFALWIVRH